MRYLFTLKLTQEFRLFSNLLGNLDTHLGVFCGFFKSNNVLCLALRQGEVVFSAWCV